MTDQTAASPLDMHTRLSEGAEIPLVGLGTWQLRGNAATDAVGWALEAGYRHIDTATAYNNEQAVPRASTPGVSSCAHARTGSRGASG